MKNLFPLIIISSTFLFSCNSGEAPDPKTGASVQQLLQSLRDSIKKYPSDTLLKYNLVLALQDAGHYKEAVQVLDSMNITKGDSANLKTYFNYLYKRSELLTLAGDTTEAIKTLELFVIPGELTEAGFQLAFLYAETRNPKVLGLCDAMNKNDKEGMDPNPDYFKGVYYYNVNDYEKALEQFNSSIRKDYTFTDAYMEKGRILFKQEKYREAISVYDLAIKVSNTFADAYYWKGKCQEALGNKQEAEQNYLKAFALDQSLVEAKEAADRIKD